MPMKKPIFADKNDAGFTLIELLVVVAISAVLMTVGFLYLGGYRSEQNLKLSASELLATVKNAQRLSMSQQNGLKWGVRFRNTTSSAGQSYTVFSGTSYASGTVGQTYPVRRNISFSNPWASSTVDTIFNAVSGSPSQPQVISMVDGRQDGMVNDIIMNSLGQITSKFDTGLVGYWHFDEGTNTKAYDASGKGNTGTLYSSSTICANPPTAGCPSWQSGASCKAGNCIAFNGVDNNVILGSPLSSPSAWSYVFWFYANGAPASDWNGLIGEANNPRVTWQLNQTVNVGLNYAAGGWAGGPASGTLSPNTWYHVAAIISNAPTTSPVAHLYINGVEVASTTFAQAIRSPSGVHYLDQRDSARTFNGSIDEIRIYNRALSDTEIGDIYNSTR